MAFDFAAMAQRGKLFYGGHNVGLAPVQAVPTTTAGIALVNVNGDGGESLIIKSVGIWLVSGTAAAGATLLGGVSVGKIASPPTAHMTNGVSAPCRGRLAQSAAFFQASTLPGTPVWAQITANQQLAAANVGQGFPLIDYTVAPQWIVPPGYAFHLQVFSGAGTSPLYGYSLVWGEQLVTFPQS